MARAAGYGGVYNMKSHTTRKAPDLMTCGQRIEEVAHILAVGFLRMLRRTSSDPAAALPAENCLDSRAPKSVHRVEP